MRAVELSEAKARTLVDALAGQWADLAVRVACSGVAYATPFRFTGEGMTSRSFLARVKRRKETLAAIGDLLAQLGATLPEVDKAACLRRYKPPIVRKAGDCYVTGLAGKEKERLAALIRESAT